MSEISNHSAVKFKYGDANTFETMTKDSNTIYFIHAGDGTNRIYVGEDCYNVTVVQDLDNTVLSTKTVPSTDTVRRAINSRVGMCRLVTGDTVPSPIEIENNVEYRYINITEITGVTIKTASYYEPDLFYCSIVLNNVSSSDSVVDFVTVDPTSGTNIKFLNPDVNLSDMDTLELLFFWNGLDICCIAASYKHQEEGE